MLRALKVMTASSGAISVDAINCIGISVPNFSALATDYNIPGLTADFSVSNFSVLTTDYNMPGLTADISVAIAEGYSISSWKLL